MKSSGLARICDLAADLCNRITRYGPPAKAVSVQAIRTFIHRFSWGLKNAITPLPLKSLLATESIDAYHFLGYADREPQTTQIVSSRRSSIQVLLPVLSNTSWKPPVRPILCPADPSSTPSNHHQR